MSKAFTLRALLVILVMWGSTSHAQSVWPGDVNNNGVVNGIDILYWGVANGKTGGVRTGASTNWAAQNMGQPWLWNFAEPNGMNYAYADCNGDGKVDVNDATTAIKDNFWKKRNSVTEDLISPSGTDIKLDLSISNLESGSGSPGQQTLIKVMLSKQQLAKVDFYGIAFTLKYDPKLISSEGILFQKSNSAWIDPTNNKSYLFQKNLYEEGKCEIAITRTDLTVVDGSGEIGKLEFYLRNDSGSDKQLEIKIENVRIIDSKLKSYSVNNISYKTIVRDRDPEGGNNNDDDDDDDDDDSDNNTSCPQVVDPVCGKDGKVYLNSCYAKKAGVTDYTPGVCNPDCIDPTQINPDAICPAVYDPVCGCNGVTYANECEAKAAGVKSYKKGACKENNNCYDPNLVLSAAYTTLNNNNGVITISTPTTDDPVCGCNGVTYKNSYAAEASGIKTYTKGKCSTSCVDPLRIDPNAICTLEYAPVCGCNGVTYTNACKAEAAGVVSYTPGVCGSNNTPAWCNKATPINCGDFLSGENTANAGNSISTYPCSNKNYSGPEKVYIINKSGAGDLQIGLEILTSGLDLDLFLLSPNCNTITCLKSSTTNNSQTNNEGIVLEDAPAGTYYLVVDGAAAGQYRLELSCGNLNCTGAVALTCGQTYSGKNNDGYDNVSLYGCSSNTLNVENNGPEKVHTFTISQAGPVSITLTGLSANLELFLLNSCDRGSCIEFSQNSGTNSETITANLQPGTYYVVVDGNNGATSNYKLTVNCAEATCNLGLTLTATAATCGQNSGTIKVQTTGGSPAYIVAWSGPVSGNLTTSNSNITLQGLPAGTYTITVTDCKNCKVTKTVTVNSGGNLTAQTTVTNANCGQKGKVKIVVGGGSPKYIVYLSGAESGTFESNSATFEVSDLIPGAYHLYIKDNSGCSVSKDFNVSQQESNFYFTATPSPAACETPGSIAIKTFGGTAPYKVYVTGPKSGSVNVNATNFNLVDLPGGNYTVKIIDANGCSYSLSVTITTGELLASITPQNGTCVQPGSIKINITSGKPNFIISWSGPVSSSVTTSNTTYTIPNLPAGSYTITIKDGNWCAVMKVVTILGGESGFDVVLVPENGICETKAAINVKVEGGTKPYKITWTGPAGGNITTEGTYYEIANLPSGNYSVSVKDVNGCTVSSSTQVVVANSGLALNLTVKNATCLQSGAILVDVDGGFPNYAIKWEGPVNGSYTSNTDKYEIKNLPPGTYKITVFDNNWCSVSKTVTIVGASEGFDIILHPENGACETKGAVGIEILGGGKPYNVSWSGPVGGNATVNGTNYEFSNLPNGTYNVTVKDVNGCSVTESTQVVVANSGLSLESTTKNATCIQSGGILLDINGGIAKYIIKWEGPVNGTFTSNTDKYEITNLPPGTYKITITDGNWCMLTKTIVVTGSTEGFDIDLTPENGACEMPGGLSLKINGGTKPYKVTWSGPAGGNATVDGYLFGIDNLPGGTYSVKVVDKNGCSVTENTQILVANSNLSLVFTAKNATCVQSGSVLVDVNGGSANYVFEWSGPVNGSFTSSNDKYEILNLPAGTYTIKVTDGNWCRITKTVVITGSSEGFDIDLTPENGACEMPGGLSLKINGGTKPYKVTWSGPAGGNATVDGYLFGIDNLPSGTYSVKVVDKNGCSVTENTQILVANSNLSLVFTAKNATCVQSGSVLVDVNGGSPNYVFEWSGPVNGSFTSSNDKYEILNLPAGTYTIKVTDGNWCRITKTVVITGSSEGFDIDLTPENGACEMPGGLSLKINGGTKPYKVTWSGPAGGNATVDGNLFGIDNLPGGTYSVKVVDKNGCSVTENTQILVANSNLSLVFTAKNATCVQSGSVLVDVNGGSPNYVFEWSGPVNGSFTSSNDKYEILNLPAGTYTIKVTDGNWCRITKTVVITGSSEDFDIDLTPENGACETPGDINIKVNGGTKPYKITWSGPAGGNATVNANTYQIPNLPGGTYTVNVKDVNGCSVSESTQILVANSSLSLKLLTKEATCVQGGGILVDVDGGIANYVIKWEGPTNGTFTSGSDKYEITNLVPGTYTIKVTDGNWCTITKTITVNGSAAGLVIVLTPENGVCTTAASINVDIKTGQAPYKITWTGPASGSATSDTKLYDINNLPAGTYTVVVKDVNGCTVTKGMQVVTGESNLYTTLSISSGNCGANGSILLNIFNGEPVYQVSWSGPVNGTASTSASSVEIKNLPSGTYSVKVIDKNGCSYTKTIGIANSPADLFKATAVNGACESLGAIKLTFLGLNSYTIQWTGTQNGSAVANGSGYNIIGLPAGTYTVKVTDGNGCVETETVQISASESNLSFTTSFSSAACGQNGIIKVTVNSGTPNYKITWDGPQDGSYTTSSNVYEIKNIPAGAYTITVMDGNWCTASKTVSLSETPGNVFTATPHHGACESLGSIALNFNSGVSPYKVQWSGPVGGTVSESGVGYNIIHLPAGTYTVKVTDNQGCVDTKTVTINVSQNNLGVNASLIAGACGQYGTIWVNILGGAPTYMVTWEGPQNGSQQLTANGFEIPNVPPGKYTITIKDANWCMTSTMITVYQSPGMIFNATPKNGICETPGSIKLNFTSGTQPYSIQWTGPAPGSATTAANEFTIQNLPVGTYTVKVTDKNGCVNTKTVTVGQDQGGINVNVSLIVNDCGQYNTIWIDYNGGNPPYVVVWEGPVSGMDTTNNNGYEIPNLPPGKYTITIKDSNWCFVSKMITIYETPANIFTATPIGGGCDQNGGIKLAFTGTPNYKVILGGTVKDTFTITTNTDTIPNLPAGTYTVKVTDAKGCTETETVTVTGAGNLLATITSENGTCDSTGSIKVNITAGTGPFSIILAGALSDTLIANNIGISTIANLNAGSYIITVKAASGCAVTDTVTITITEGLVDFTTTQVGGTCSSSSALLLNIEGGNPNYTITWSGQGGNGSATTANNTFTIPNLSAGNYTITVKDVSSCVESELVKITAGESNLAVSATVTNGTCGQAGQVLVSATGGTAPFTFSWNGGSTSTSNPTYTIQNLNSGTYSVSVQDAGGCSQAKMVSVTNSNQMPVANFSFTVNGTAVTFINQSSPGTYQWSFGDNGGASNLNNPNHSYGNIGTFNACLKVTNTCGTQEICKQITIGAPQGAAVIDVQDGQGSKGATIYIPVVIENCITGATVSFAGSLKIENTNVATITGIVPGSISPQYSANNQTFSFFSNNGAGIPCGVGQILFYVAVELKGNSGASTILNIVNTPLPIELGGMVNGAPTVVPHYITSGQISILSTARVKGEITTYWGAALPDIEVKITGENYDKTEITDSLGRYSKPEMPLSKEYTIVPRFNDAPENGLSTYALFAGQRFILGMQPEEIVSPYQIIAGDANCDNRFSSLDLFIIQRLIIGTSTSFGTCPSWVFVRAGEQMPIDFNTVNVFPYPTCDTLMLMKDTISNFVGVKVGDILGHANPANIHGTNPRSNGILNLWATNRPIRAGEIVEIPLTSDNFQSIAAYQLGLSFDFTKLDFVEVVNSENTAFAKIALNDKQADEGVLRMSWFDFNGQGITLQPNEKLFTLRFVALKDMESLTQALAVNSRYIRSEAYNNTAEQLKIQLNFNNAATTATKEETAYGYKLYQNVPNPFNQRTMIGFDLPKAMQADVVIFDQLGKVVKTYSGNYNRGYNQLEMPRETLSAGVYYYTLRTADFAATKPMIVFE